MDLGAWEEVLGGQLEDLEEVLGGRIPHGCPLQEFPLDLGAWEEVLEERLEEDLEVLEEPGSGPLLFCPL